MIRHKSFENENELQSFLIDFVPKDAYVSCAAYENPEAEMDKKIWLGADLVFDIDADHIPTSCDKRHDEWRCNKCNFEGKGVTPEICPICANEKFVTMTWPCEVCLGFAKEQTQRLIEILMNDFGFCENEIDLFFSGHRGYHVQVTNNALKDLGSQERREIVDYVCGLGYDHSNCFIMQNARLRYNSEKIQGEGISGQSRATKYVMRFIEKAQKEDYSSIGLRRNAAETMVKNRNIILKRLDNQSFFELGMRGLGLKTWMKVLNSAMKSAFATVDTVVTTDVHRLIRLTESLHGKTGFRKMNVSLSDLADFDPFKDALAFTKGDVRVSVSSAPTLRVADEVFGPYKNQEVELPTAAAILLICKKAARVLE